MGDPDRQKQVLHQALQALTHDDRVAAVGLIGSGADGFIDDLSDIDLLVVVHQEEEVERVHADWAQTVHELFPVLHHPQTPFTEANQLNIFILDGLLELDMSFVAVSRLQIHRDRGRIMVDRSGTVRERLAHAEPPAMQVEDHLWVLDQACHRVMECRKALHRGKLWQASLVLDELRSFTVQLASLVRFGSKRQRDADGLPDAFLAMLSVTIVPVESQQLHAALGLLTPMMLDQAEQLYARAGAEFPHRFASALLAAVSQGSSSSSYES